MICKDCHLPVSMEFCSHCGSAHIKEIVTYNVEICKEIEELKAELKETKTKLVNRKILVDAIAERMVRNAKI